MIKHTQKIKINADYNKVWFFLMKFTQILIYDKYYYRIELPLNYSVNNQLIFKIFCDYLFMVKEYTALVQNCVPPNKFSITIKRKQKYSYNHKKTFALKKNGNGTLLFYNHSGDFNHFILNFFFILFIKLSCLNELKYIKKSIESSEIDMGNKKYNTFKL